MIFLSPIALNAATLEFSAWLPYWKKNIANEETLANLNSIDTLSPFSFEVAKDGTIKDAMKLKQAPWPEIIGAARAKKVKIVPSILWNDGPAIEKLMSTKKGRQGQIKQIVKIVEDNKFDGIDIDYENKTEKVIRTFAAFIRELSQELDKKNKILSCTIEPRLPPESRFLIIPEIISYSNDYAILNRYCDEVRIMAYDQGRADITLNQRNKGAYYAPVADPRFVEKVINFTAKQINKKKLVIGLANYGYEYQITDKNKYYDYKKLRSLSRNDFINLAQSHNVAPVRDVAGELSFSYQATTSSATSSPLRFAVYSDTEAQIAKIKLAKTLGVKGVALFRLAGESEPSFWEALK